MTSSFGEKLRNLRIENKKTLKDLADELGVSVVYISDVERGRRSPLSDKKIQQIAPMLNTSATVLQNCADKDRNRVELSLDKNPLFSNTALALARGWDTMTEEEAEQIMKILNKDNADE